MSMWMSAVRVNKAALEKTKADGSLIDAIFFGDDEAAQAKVTALGIAPEHTAGFDYQLAHGAFVGMAEAQGDEIDEDTVVFDELGGASEELDFDAGYGPAFVCSAEAAKAAADGLLGAMDEELGAVLEGAAKAGDCLVCVLG